ncbi:GNAT family N-acetyltransferase [Streptomyces polygonati]|uniref:GNAT family N-acetyltransferase n=1 Tax=Streptomyces polygonati TaxID=1617087 RepID=A0ABV8HJB0_9ACTN
MVRVRLMTDDDVPAVSAIRVAGWRAAYAGLVPRSYLDAMDAAEDTAARRRSLAAGGGRVRNLVAVEAAAAGGGGGSGGDGGSVVGWAAFGPYRGQPGTGADGELYALYVRPDRIGTGAGRALTAEVVRHAAEAGRRRLLLWVLADNHRARRFYGRAGFTADGLEMTEVYDGVPLRELRYARAL